MGLYLGCPVWGLKHWVGNFFPPKSKQRDFLSLYSRRLNTVEGNTTFYSLPRPETLDRWIAETPAEFKFCFKFPKTISHQLRLRNAKDETKHFVDCLTRLGDRAGPSFLQLPPNFSVSNLRSLTLYLDTLPREFRYAVEVRHADFFAEPGESQLDDVLRQRNAARCVFDTRGLRRADPSLNKATREAQERKPNVPVRFTRTASFAFVRFVGHPQLSENADLLDEWVGHVADWLKAGDDVFFFCHVPEDRDAPLLCRDIHARVNEWVELPPLPEWGEDVRKGEQERLL
jgi:uncharacterized protein YecE (DUF72 family)